MFTVKTEKNVSLTAKGNTKNPQPPHPIQRRYLAERLVRLRRADEHQRYASSQRQGRIDPNPHQIDAVIFALKRIPEGGCILADEVGLGKTIEAGLVIAQLRAEGAASRVLLVVPKPLLLREISTACFIATRPGQQNSGEKGDYGIADTPSYLGNLLQCRRPQRT